MQPSGIQVICIGTELLLGETVNTNLAFLGQSLNAVGLMVDREYAIPDTPDVMLATLRQALAEARVVITVGGLGPTSDDLTKELVAQVLGQSLAIDPAVVDEIRRKYIARHVEPKPRACERQAQMPEKAVPIANDWGTAPGVWCDQNGRTLVMLPGPPRELRPMFGERVLPKIVDLVKPLERRLNISVFGMPESTIEHRVIDVLEPFPEVVPSYCTRAGSCLVRLSATLARVDRLEAAAEAVLAAFGDDAVRGEVDLVKAVDGLLRARGWRFGTAESCTGGGIGYRATELPGISDVFAGGVIAYSNELKVALLGVREETLAAHGAVSEETAAEMAAGLCERLHLQAGISVTGIAGPDGGTAEKPVGTVCIATCVNGQVRTLRERYPYDRQGVRERTIGTALNQLRHHLLDTP